MLISPMAVIIKSPVARPLVPTSVASNPEFSVPYAKAEGTTLLFKDATKDSLDSSPPKAIKLPVTKRTGPTDR